MPSGIYIRTEEHKRNIGLSHIGKKQSLESIAKRTGKKRTIKMRKKMSVARMGIKFSEETRSKMSLAKKGKPKSKEAIEKQKISLKKFYQTEEGIKVKEKIRQASIKMNLKRYPIETRDATYSIDWTNSLRISIRERDHYTCQLCGEKQGDISFSVHHIDYDKNNCNPVNLTSLCKSCHMKTNNNREYWKQYFINKVLTKK